MNDKYNFKELLEKYNQGICSQDEKAAVESWLISQMKTQPDILAEEEVSSAQDRVRKVLVNHIDEDKPSYRLWPRIVAAAAVLIFVGVGLYFYRQISPKVEMTGNGGQTGIEMTADINPGKQGATLTLANGKTIRLTDASNGELAKEAGIRIDKTANGQIVYTTRHVEGGTTERPVSDRSLSAVEMTGKVEQLNTLSTAKGETYVVILPDGSKVWLNAASSLTYSATLIKQGVRSVKLEGEAYFEVAKDKAHPFIVGTKNQEVEVLGTHFNINSYANEPVVKTTLLEGSVRVSASSRHVEGTVLSRHVEGTVSSRHVEGSAATRDLSYRRDDGKARDDGSGLDASGVILKPNQQATLTATTIKTTQVDPNIAVAWKNNEFTFQGQSIDYIMRMVERWYNVEVIYVGAKPTEKYFGGVSRFDKVSKVLQTLEFSGGVHFKVEGRKIFVSR